MTTEPTDAELAEIREAWGTLTPDPVVPGVLRASKDPTTGILVGVKAPIIAKIINAVTRLRSQPAPSSEEVRERTLEEAAQVADREALTNHEGMTFAGAMYVKNRIAHVASAIRALGLAAGKEG